jgi:hypothetical protein
MSLLWVPLFGSMLGIVENEISGFISPDINCSTVLNSCFEEAGMWESVGPWDLQTKTDGHEAAHLWYITLLLQ